jgi:cell division protein ZapB
VHLNLRADLTELRHENHTTAGRARNFSQEFPPKPYNPRRMPNTVQIDQIAERVERLLLRHEELQRTNALLSVQVESLVQERDSLKSRLGAARARVDALLDRLPRPDADPSQGEDGSSTLQSPAKKVSGLNRTA